MKPAFLEDVAGFVINGGKEKVSKRLDYRLAHLLNGSRAFVFATILVSDFAVVVLVCGVAEQPATGSELQDLEQQQTGHGGEAFLQQEAVPQQEEQLVHALAVRGFQLLPDAVQLQHQTIHLKREEDEMSTTLLARTFMYDVLRIYLSNKLNNCILSDLLLIQQSVRLCQPHQTVVYRMDQGPHRRVVHLNTATMINEHPSGQQTLQQVKT